jgi:hypothetical protein
MGSALPNAHRRIAIESAFCQIGAALYRAEAEACRQCLDGLLDDLVMLHAELERLRRDFERKGPTGRFRTG